MPSKDDEARPRFEAEEEFYANNRGQWLLDGLVDDWVVLDGAEVVGFYRDLGEAHADVDEKFGDRPVYIRQIRAGEEEPVSIIRFSL